MMPNRVISNQIAYSMKRDTLFQFERILAILSFCGSLIYYFLLKNINIVIPLNLLLMFFVCHLLMYFTAKGKSLRMITIFLALYIELIIMPLLILYGSQIKSSTPIWYCSSIMLIILIVEPRDLWWLLTVSLYLGTYLYTNLFIWKTSDTHIGDRIGFYTGFAFSFIGVAFALSLALLRMEKNYKKAEQKIIESHDIEKQAGMAKSRFLANMSHEIRTPMNSIIGLSELVLKDEMDDASRNEIMLIKNSAYDLLEIIDDVLMFSKLDSGKMKLMEIDFQFDTVLKSVIETTGKNITNKDIKFRTRIDHDIPKVVHGDDIRIKQILMRLMFISISLTENGRLMLDIDSTRNEDETEVTFKIIISDTGCGLSEIDLDAIYGAYDTYDSRQNSNLKGISLKFNICKELLAMMGGTLKTRSIEGVGLETEIEFTLPIIDKAPILVVNDPYLKNVCIFINDKRELLAWQDIMEGFKMRPMFVTSQFSFDKAIHEADYDFIFVPAEQYDKVSALVNLPNFCEKTYIICGKTQSYGDFGKCRIIRHPVSALSLVNVLNGDWKAADYILNANEVEYDGSAAQILVVDDNNVNLKVAEGIFKTLHITVDTAKSGEQALKMLNEKEYHMVFLDMVMPEMSGTETLNLIRASEKQYMKDVPVIALTANSGGNIREEVLASGYQEYLGKPIKQRYLIQILTTFISTDIFKVKTVEVPVNDANMLLSPTVAKLDEQGKKYIEDLKNAIEILDFEKLDDLFDKLGEVKLTKVLAAKVAEIKELYTTLDIKAIDEVIRTI